MSRSPEIGLLPSADGSEVHSPEPRRLEPQQPEPSRPELRRPAPAPSRTERWRTAAGAVTERLRRQPNERPAVDSQPALHVALAAIGAAVFTVALLWGWQAWSGRSAPPIDTLLPRLVPAESAGAEPPAVTSGATEPASPAPAPDVAQPVGSQAFPADPDTAEQELPIVVHVAGAVRSPGVVDLTAGARVFQALDAAGGVQPHADLDRMNLAAVLIDGERLWVPAIDEQAQPELVARHSAPAIPGVAGTGVGNAFADSPIDLNRASQAELETLPGIGPSLAQAIITTRNERGPFLTVDELVEVGGIGPAKLEQLRPRLVVRALATGG